ncbi:alpha/beta-hydrolase [Auriscalpium vulgare]|uniref:Alpha/beta-hydrolase n=1 Tax=Auriscalpium vulgare TaxID=40419 RepID=A0ACB8SAS2_9AGAM|nr:alpha/beta-hydrolase [Auriscalpium vulgare]
MSSEQPFKVFIPDADLDNLRKRLELTRFPDELPESGWDYGAPLANIQRLVKRWRDGYDWRAAEAEMNLLPMFTRDIDVDGFGTLNIHYVHSRSASKNAVPLLFLHGWPGNFLEVAKILPLLTAESDDHPSFHVVAMSLPGFTFSQGPSFKGFAGKQYAETANKLMLALGYDEYVTQGGDWGFTLTREIAGYYGGKHVKAWHTNFPSSRVPRLKDHPWYWLMHLITPYKAWEHDGLARTRWFRDVGCWYSYQQGTYPQTLGYALADSPVGLLAWIYEKMVTWSDNYPWTDDEVLTWVSLYWFSRAGPTASLRIYKEVDESRYAYKPLQPTLGTVPMGVSWFPRDLFVTPRYWMYTIGRVVFEAVHESGGHFASHERPDELVNDVRKMFGKGGPAFAVVPGKNGYD